jgi:hypothetical protein
VGVGKREGKTPEKAIFPEDPQHKGGDFFPSTFGHSELGAFWAPKIKLQGNNT